MTAPNKGNIIRILTTIALALSLSVGVFAQTRPSVTVRPITDIPQPVMLVIDGKVLDAESLQILRGQQVMIALRELETLGWGTASALRSGEVVFSAKGVTLSFIKGQGVAKVNSLAVQLPVDTYTKSGRLMVPLSFVAKALGYDYDITHRAVATVKTSVPAKPVVKSGNTIKGQLTYAGKGIGGITVRMVDDEFNSIKGAIARTDEKGNYEFEGLPDGDYMAYVYIADNPAYFNRASETVTVKNGQTMQIKPLSVGRILAPKTPAAGKKVSAVDGKLSFVWTACEAAASYELVIRKPDTDDAIVRVTRNVASASIPAAKLRTGVTYEAIVTALDANGDYLGGTAGAGGKPWSFVIQAGKVTKK